MRTSIIIVCATAALVAGCATKRYPIATELSEAEVGLMDCDDLALEMVRAENVRSQITETAETDWRSVAGFLGDYGIGNSMAKNEAEQALEGRIQSIRTAQSRRDCL